MRRSAWWAAGALVAATLVAMPTTTTAVFPGERGRIAFVRGQAGEANDNGADVFILAAPNGNVIPLDTRPGQHRHPAWSPDLKKVAYALWNPPTNNNNKIWVHDLASDDTDRLGPHASNVQDDRPSFSPDGSRIAYESEVTDGSGQMDILIQDITGGASGGPFLNLTASANFIEGKPVWSPDGKRVYYSRRPVGSLDDDIFWELSDGSGQPQPVLTSATAEYQPSLSPDGTKLCYTRGPFGSDDAQVWVRVFGTTSHFELSDANVGAYNCAWSPDGRFIAYVRGTFSNGALMYERADDTGVPQLLTTDTPGHFDGNPDWAPKRPAFCSGQPITIAGTDGGDVIDGTSGRDVINAFGGHDVVRGQGGKDRICGGKGNDRLFGGIGKDVLFGGPGNDRLNGGGGVDVCQGGPGADVLRDC